MLEKARKIDVKRHYDVLHSIPEIGFELPRTIKYIRGVLENLGYCITECGGGVVAEAGKGEKTILLRADMDALLFDDGAFHACGHDMHASMLLGAAELIKCYEDDLLCKVILMFQPAEEILQGASSMISAGILDSGVDAAIMLHVLTAVPFKTGTLIIPPIGVSAPSADIFNISMVGKGCHGSTPWLGSDITSAVNCTTMLLGAIPCHVSPPSSATVLSIGSVKYGDVPNVIADNAIVCGSFRTFDYKVRDDIKSRIISISDAIGNALKLKIEVDFKSGCPCFVNDKQLCEWAKKRVYEVVGNDRVAYASDLPVGGGSEDFAFISQKVPSIMLTLAAGSISDGYREPLHSRKVKFDINALPYGTAILADFAFSYFKKNGPK